VQDRAHENDRAPAHDGVHDRVMVPATRDAAGRHHRNGE
jgi:hypothetical protein